MISGRAVRRCQGCAAGTAVRPDGNTLLFSPIGPIAIQPSFMRNAGYRAVDLAPVCMVKRRLW